VYEVGEADRFIQSAPAPWGRWHRDGVWRSGKAEERWSGLFFLSGALAHRCLATAAGGREGADESWPPPEGWTKFHIVWGQDSCFCSIPRLSHALVAQLQCARQLPRQVKDPASQGLVYIWGNLAIVHMEMAGIGASQGLFSIITEGLTGRT
jgi:hypothetical protein